MAIIALVLNIADQALAHQYAPLLHGLLRWLQPGHYLIFATSMACILNRRPGLLALGLGLTYLATWHRIQYDLVTPGTAILLGILAAQLTNALITEGRPQEEA